MEINNLINSVNLILDIALVVVYGAQVYKVYKKQIDGQLKWTKRALVILFVAVAIMALVQTAVYLIAIFDKIHIIAALYLLNFNILVLNISLTIVGIIFAIIINSTKE